MSERGWSGFLRSIFGPNKEEIWRQLAEQAGGKFSDGGFWSPDAVEVEFKDWVITLDTYTVSTGRTSATFTRIRAPYINRDGFRFHVYRAGLFAKMGRLLGMQDVAIGDPEFDREFVVKGNDEEQIRLFFRNERMRALMRSQPSLSLRVADDEGWFGRRFPEGADELRFETSGILMDIDRLRRLFDLFAEILDHLCRIGSAYEGDPFDPHSPPAADTLLRAASGGSSGDDLLRPASSAGTSADTLLRPDRQSNGPSSPEPAAE